MKNATNFRFEFEGGCKDGEVAIEGPSGRYGFLSDAGRIGAQFREPREGFDEAVRAWLDATLSRHSPLTHEEMYHLAKMSEASCPVYEVVERNEGPDETVVRVQFVGESGDKLAAIQAAENITAVVGSGVAARLQVEVRCTSDQDEKAWHEVLNAVEYLFHSGSITTSFSTNSLDSSIVYGFSCWFKDEAIARTRIAEAIQKFLPGADFTIERVV